MNPIEEKIRLALQSSLIGEIYPEIKAVVYSYNVEEKIFLLRYYLDREPIEEDYENISEVMAEFISHFKFSTFEKLKEECSYSSSKQKESELDPLDGFVYLRKKNLDFGNI